MDSTVEKLPPHVLLFPFPAHSHIHFLLNLAELLCCRGGLSVTFLVADQTHRHLLNDAAVRSRFDRYSGFRFQNLGDGLPVDDSQRPTLDKTTEFGFSFLEAAKLRFKDVLISSSSDWQKEDSRFAGKSSIACIIADSMMASFAVDVAGEAGIPIMCYHNACPSDLWAVLCVPKLIEAGEIPFQGDDLDVPIANVPGLEGLLRRRDLSSFLRVGDLSDKNTQFIMNGASQTRRARMILNTFEELEGPALTQIRSQVWLKLGFSQIVRMIALMLDQTDEIGRQPRSTEKGSINAKMRQELGLHILVSARAQFAEAQKPRGILTEGLELDENY